MMSQIQSKIRRYFIAIFIFSFINIQLEAQVCTTADFEWVRNLGGSGHDVANSITTDAAGNVYTTGYFRGTVDFDPSNNTFNLTSNGLNDVFISKVDAIGNFVWAKALGGTSYDNTNSITIDTAGNVYITGYFYGTADFDPGSSTFNITSNGQADAFVTKLDNAGNFIWAKALGGAAYDEGYSITTDVAGNIYTTGYFRGTVDFDPSSTTFNLTSNGQSDAFIAKLDNAGNFIWAKNLGGTLSDKAKSITTDVAGNVYTTGSFQGTVDFDPSSTTFNLTSNGQSDAFISKLDSLGDFIWAKNLGGTLNVSPSSITTDTAGNVYTAGFFYGTVDFDPGNSAYNIISNGAADAFISKLDASGNFVWAKTFGGNLYDIVNALITDTAGNVYTSGKFYGTVDFDPSSNTFNLTSNGNIDVFISKLDPSGNFVWAKAMGGISSDIANSLTIDAVGNVYTTGRFSGTADFDPSSNTFNLTSNGGADAYILKLSQCAFSASITAQTNVTCNGVNTGTATVTPDPGSSPYSYSWSNGDTTATISGLTAGTYTVTVTNNIGETDTISVTITPPGIIIAIISAQTNVAINGQNTGSATVTASNGAPSYSYLWSNGDTSVTASGLAAGTYTVTITDGGFCTQTASVIILESPVGANLNCTSTDFEWAKSTGGTLYDRANSITTDATGNLYTTGSFSGTVDFDPSSNTFNMTSNGSSEIFISKSDAFGNFIWAKSVGGTSYDAANSITMDAAGKVYVTGSFSGTVDFDPNSNIHNLTSNGVSDAFILKLDTSGNFIWAKNIGGTSYDGANSITTDATGNVYTAGSFEGTVDFDPNSGIYNITSNGATDAFISKLDTSGNFIWAKNIGGTSSDVANSITTDATGSVYATGYFFGTADFDPSNSTFNKTSNGGADAFISKLDASGNFIWANSLGASYDDRASSITTDALGNVYTTGYFQNTVDFDPSSNTYNITSNGSGDAFVSKLDASGNFIWAKNQGGSSNDKAISITTDALGNVYSTGYFSGTVDFDPNSSTFNITSNGIIDSYISKLDASGNFIWAKNIGGTQYAFPNSIVTDAFGNVYTAGYFYNTVDFDPSSNTFNITSNGDADAFSVKLSQCGFSASITAQSNISCNGASNGSATVTLDGGASPFTYAWSNGDTTAMVSSLDTGTYTVTITENDGMTASTSVILTEPVAITANISAQTNLLCNGINTGTATVTASGGTGTLAYLWPNSDTTATVTGLSANSFTVTVTDDNSCTQTALVTITEPTMLTTVTSVTSNATCLSNTDASGNVTASGGSPGYAYVWSNGTTVNSASNLSVGTYYITITDTNSCTTLDSIIIGVTDLISPIVLTQSINIYIDGSGNASITASDIDNGSSDNCLIDTMSLDSTQFDCSELGMNTVTLTVTDVNGNISTDTAVVTVMDTLNPIVITQDITVYLDPTGQVNITTANIDNGSNDNCSINTMSLDSTHFDCSKLGVNTVTLTVFDASGNSMTQTATVTILDTIAPTVVGQDMIVYLDSNGAYMLYGSMVDMGTTDNCVFDSVYLTNNMVTCTELGTQSWWLYGVDMSGNVDSVSFNLTVSDTIVPTIICPSDTVICEDIFTFNDPQEWDNCTATVTQTSSFVSGDYYAAGTYIFNYEVSDVSGNTSTCSYQLEVNPVPLTTLGADTTVGAGTLIPFTNVSNTANSFLWSDGSTDSILAVNFQYDSTIWVQVTSPSGCVSSDTIVVSVLLGIGESQKEAAISLYPNPAHNEFNVQLKNWSAEEIQITFMALDGKIIRTHKLINASANEQVHFDTEHLARGVYIVRITDGTNQSITRVILQ